MGAVVLVILAMTAIRDTEIISELSMLTVYVVLRRITDKRGLEVLR